jgi:gamma-glutamylcyclotransferase (GGCT)/AIG2-like uncharacterized protein YtfP
MCIIISKPAGKTIPAEHISNSHANNADGVGIMHADEGKVVIEKWLDKDHDKFEARLGELKDKNVVVHYRAASVGKVTLENIHPFWIFEEKLAMCHNGTIYNAKPLAQRDESDTVAFARLLKDFPEDFLQRDGLLMMMSNYIGTSSRLAFLDHEGNVAIMNKKLGEEIDGIWYSNKYYSDPNMRGGCGVEFPSAKKRSTSVSYDGKTYEYSYSTGKRVASDNSSYGGLFDSDNRRGKLPLSYQLIDLARKKDDKQRVYCFVYGTLKSGYGNNRVFDSSAKLVGDAVTLKRFPMIGKGMGFPYVIDKEGMGRNIKGELWETSVANVNAGLDSLEGYPHHYVRRVIDVATTEGTYKAVCYFKANVTSNDMEKEFLSEWTRDDSYSKSRSIVDTFLADTVDDCGERYEDGVWEDYCEEYVCLDCGFSGAEGEFTADHHCPHCLSDDITGYCAAEAEDDYPF